MLFTALLQANFRPVQVYLSEITLKRPLHFRLALFYVTSTQCYNNSCHYDLLCKSLFFSSILMADIYPISCFFFWIAGDYTHEINPTGSIIRLFFFNLVVEQPVSTFKRDQIAKTLIDCNDLPLQFGKFRLDGNRSSEVIKR